MRTLAEIVDDVKDGKKPDYEELRYALLAYSAISFFDREALIKNTKETPDFIFKMRQDDSIKRIHAALNKSPKEFVGWNNDPDNPEYLKFRKFGEILLSKVIKENETKKNS